MYIKMMWLANIITGAVSSDREEMMSRQTKFKRERAGRGKIGSRRTAMREGKTLLVGRSSDLVMVASGSVRPNSPRNRPPHDLSLSTLQLWGNHKSPFLLGPRTHPSFVIS